MQIAVIGGGAAGMMAAYAAGAHGAQVDLFDHNEKLGKKLYITGKGRCNLCNDSDRTVFFEHVVHNAKFLFSAYGKFDSTAVRSFFEEYGVKSKVERGGRVFPQSDKSSDVIKAFGRALEEAGVRVHLSTKVDGIMIRDGQAVGLYFKDGRQQLFDRVIVATGGRSYPSTGSTGDGYRFAAAVGHTVVAPRPALVPILLKGVECQGLSLKNVRLTVTCGDRVLASEIGEMLFTDSGISGPIALTVSSYLTRQNLKGCLACIDLKPALTEEQLDLRLQRDFAKYINKAYKNALDDLLPKSLIPVIIRRSGIDPDKKINQITASERKAILANIKRLCYPIEGLDKIEYAIVTSGGVSVEEIRSNSMESKLIRHLYFAGEVLDLDALTGGFNLQIAFCTGFLAGLKSAEES